jgi:hypothetical protein
VQDIAEVQQVLSTDRRRRFAAREAAAAFLDEVMTEANSESGISILRLILVPALISLAITVLRLVGEMRHWSEEWFSTDTGGTVPHGLSWVIGITWLALPCGVYFGFKLVAAGQAPPKIARALALAAAGLVMLLALRLIFKLLGNIPFPQVLIIVWLWHAGAAAIQWGGWRDLFRVLLAYGLAARIPVAVIMLLAMIGNWGTHYDYVGMPPQFQMPLLAKYLWLAFFPQLVFWVGFTIVVGSVAGTITAAILLRLKPATRREATA